MKGYTVLVIEVLRLGYQAAMIEQLRGDQANERIHALRAAPAARLVDLVPDGDE